MNLAWLDRQARRKDEKEEPPPVLSSWKGLYVIVFLYTCGMILALYLMTLFLNR